MIYKELVRKQIERLQEKGVDKSKMVVKMTYPMLKEIFTDANYTRIPHYAKRIKYCGVYVEINASITGAAPVVMVK